MRKESGRQHGTTQPRPSKGARRGRQGTTRLQTTCKHTKHHQCTTMNPLNRRESFGTWVRRAERDMHMRRELAAWRGHTYRTLPLLPARSALQRKTERTAYVYTVAIKEDTAVDVDASGRQLCVSGQRRRRTSRSAESSTFEYCVTLPGDAVAQRVSYTVHNNTLTVRVPRQ